MNSDVYITPKEIGLLFVVNQSTVSKWINGKVQRYTKIRARTTGADNLRRYHLDDMYDWGRFNGIPINNETYLKLRGVRK
jgi:hypothetical protein